jgi:precorrin-6B methylase 2
LIKFPFRSQTILPAILLLALLLPLAPLPACTEAFAYMDTERSVKLDAPFLPTPNYVIAEILSKAGVGKDDILYDLGSGDGRIVIEAAKQTGCRAVGIEIDADLVDDSRFNATRAGVQDRVRFIVADLFKEDFSEATVVTLYMGQDVNLRLRPKLLRELKPGTRIASYTFDMGEWKPDNATSFGMEDAYFWVVPANASGKWIWTEGKGRAKVQWEMELKQVFQEFSGQISRNGRPFPLRGGKIKGDEIRFSLDGDPADKPSTLVFTGRIRGNTIEGAMSTGASRQRWRTTRNPATMQQIDH